MSNLPHKSFQTADADSGVQCCCSRQSSAPVAGGLYCGRWGNYSILVGSFHLKEIIFSPRQCSFDQVFTVNIMFRILWFIISTRVELKVTDSVFWCWVLWDTYNSQCITCCRWPSALPLCGEAGHCTALNHTSKTYSSHLKHFPPKCNNFGAFCCSQTAFSFGITFPQLYKIMVLQAECRV